MLGDLVARLREYDWFEISNENVNTPYIVRFLFGRLIEREPENHLDICTFIKEINEKFKINQETRDWLVLQLEEELDATDDVIITNNLELISSFSIETYRVDVGLLNIIKINVNIFFKNFWSEIGNSSSIAIIITFKISMYYYNYLDIFCLKKRHITITLVITVDYYNIFSIRNLYF